MKAKTEKNEHHVIELFIKLIEKSSASKLMKKPVRNGPEVKIKEKPIKAASKNSIR